MRTTLLIAILLCCNSLSAQTNNIPLTIGYYGVWGIQPGLKLGTSFDIKQLNSNNNRTNSLFVAPQIGGFTKPQTYNAVLLNVDAGYKTLGAKKGFYHAFSAGVGLLNQFRITSVTVNLGSGEKTKNRTTETSILPVVNYEIGQGRVGKLNWHFKLSYGKKVGFNTANAGFAAVEVGTRLYLFKQKSNTDG